MLNWTLFVFLPAMKLAVYLDSGGKTVGEHEVKLPVIVVPEMKLEKQKGGRLKSMINSATECPRFPLSIKYDIETDNQDMHESVREVIHIYQTTTCLQFTKVNQNPHILFKNNKRDTCFADSCFVGFRPNEINIPPKKCLSAGHRELRSRPGRVWKMVAYGLGMVNQHTAPNRDKYVTVQWENIPKKWHSHFQFCTPTYHNKQPSLNCHTDVPYDFTSVMHYSNNYGKIKGTKAMTLTVKPGFEPYKYSLGVISRGPSFYDTKQVNQLYCSHKCRSNTPNCVNGGYKNPANCQICLCPIGFEGKICDQIAKSTRHKNCGGNLKSSNKWKIMEIKGDNVGLLSKGIECVWWIKAEPHMRVQFYLVTKFHLGFYSLKEQMCHANFLEIKYLKDLALGGAKYCGFETAKVVSWTNWMIVRYSLQKRFIAESLSLEFTAKFRQVTVCMSNPCQNGGKCFEKDSESGDYKCKCAAQFLGVNCELQKGQPITTNPAWTKNPLVPPESPKTHWNRKTSKNAEQTKYTEKPGKNQEPKITKQANEIGVDEGTTEENDSDTPGISVGFIAAIIIALLMVVILLSCLIFAAVNRRKKYANTRRETSIGDFVKLPANLHKKSHLSKEKTHNPMPEEKTTLTSKTITMLSKVLPSESKTIDSGEKIDGKEADRRLEDEPADGQKSTQKVTQSTFDKLPYWMTGKAMTSQSKKATSVTKRRSLTPGGGHSDSTRIAKPSMSLGNSKTVSKSKSRTAMSGHSRTAKTQRSTTVKGMSNYLDANGVPFKQQSRR